MKTRESAKIKQNVLSSTQEELVDSSARLEHAKTKINVLSDILPESASNTTEKDLALEEIVVSSATQLEKAALLF